MVSVPQEKHRVERADRGSLHVFMEDHVESREKIKLVQQLGYLDRQEVKYGKHL